MASLTIEQLPPYGYMYRDFRDGGMQTSAPFDWRTHDGGDEWGNWFSKTVDAIKENIWPVYSGGVWDGAASKNAMKLTNLDFQLMRAFRIENLSQRACDLDLGDVRHRYLFQAEDEGAWWATLVRYCPILRKELVALEEVITNSSDRKSGVVDLQLKTIFQRPRPYQVAMMVGGATGEQFSYLLAKGAVTPSLVSGHTLQAAIAGCAVYAALRRSDADLAKACKVGVQQWMMDIGDRRVMAGVHYPSDSVSSWIAALRLAPHVVDCPGIGKFLKQAVVDRNRLHRFLHERLEGFGGKATYSRAMAALARAVAAA